MKKLFVKIIIYLFEKYVFDEWVDIQIKNSLEQIKKDNNLKNNEIDEFLIDRDNEKYREAYFAGKQDGYDEVYEKNNMR